MSELMILGKPKDYSVGEFTVKPKRTWGFMYKTLRRFHPKSVLTQKS